MRNLKATYYYLLAFERNSEKNNILTNVKAEHFINKRRFWGSFSYKTLFVKQKNEKSVFSYITIQESVYFYKTHHDTSK